MSQVIGGSWDGTDRPGYAFTQRKLVLFRRVADGEPDLKSTETYIRETAGDAWRFAHDGATSDADGPFHFK